MNYRRTLTTRDTVKTTPGNGGISPFPLGSGLGRESGQKSAPASAARFLSLDTLVRATPQRGARETSAASNAPIAQLNPPCVAPNAAQPTSTGKGGEELRPKAMFKCGQATIRGGTRTAMSTNIASSWKRFWAATWSPTRTSTTRMASATTTGQRTSNSGRTTSRRANARANRSTALPAPAGSGVFTLA